MKKTAKKEPQIGITNINGNEIVTIKLSTEYTYDPNYKFVQGRNEWIDYGLDNSMPTQLLKLYENSPTHQSLIALKHHMTVGGGLEYDKSNTELDSFVKNNNLNDILSRVAMDLVIFNGFSLDIGWSNSGDYVAEIGHFDFSTVRVENKPKPEWYYLNADWLNWKKNEMLKLPKFNPEKSTSQPNQILYSVSYTPGTFWYPKPDYKNTKFIQFEVELGEFTLSNIQNGMAPSGIFAFPDIPTSEERELIKMNIKRDLTGPSASGKFIAVFSESKEKQVEFIPLKNDNNSNIYNDLNNLCIQKIISGHKCNNPAIAGLPSQGGISFGNELSTSYEYYQNIVIRNYQERILSEFRRILLINGLIENPEEIKIKSSQPFQYKFDSNIIGNSVTVNEIRKEMGFDSLENGDVILFKNGQNPIPVVETLPTQLPPTTNPAPTLNNSFLVK